ncbi:tryptophan--tRNA ligase [Thioflexithrix psekupsensis]|uniref:Tryptophan--tRNA ligase n=1 Tax=Thioflexithrix psekupsensis TaxID=1570016 RepID=A0A251XA42_9GAMM|nr:tryptophan--tRNA ligase [Thioflexithrix psekupsensis]OUD15301.1 tryptophan--tRNA ligase [Thioflexithrix psekupsensis]
MTLSLSTPPRVLSGMRPTGQLHLGHLHGVLNNWLTLQYEYRCFFFAADWHALTTEYENTQHITQHVWDMIVDWLSVGINPNEATVFIQSKVPEHAELHLLLSMITPLSWLERVPTYKDQQQKLKDRDLANYGFLGYPLLQSADILIYRAGLVPVGEDQVAHIEMTREIARRFNYIYGREPDFEERAKEAKRKMGKKNAKLYKELRKRYQEQGDGEALSTAQALVNSQQNLTLGDKKRLLGYLEGDTRTILPEPEALLTKVSKMPGLDGQKMSKSYQNTISLRDNPVQIETKIRTMPTDPARVRRTDPGTPEKCPVWQFHQIYSDQKTQEWVQAGCRSADIGCLDCKQPIIDAVQLELKPIQERAARYTDDPDMVRSLLSEGCEKARATARETMEEVRQVMGLHYR